MSKLTSAIIAIGASGEGGGGSYVLPTASDTTLGGIKVGNNLSIDANGVLSAQGGSSGSDLQIINLTDYTNKVVILEGLKKGTYIIFDNEYGQVSFKCKLSSSYNSYIELGPIEGIIYLTVDVTSELSNNSIIGYYCKETNQGIIEKITLKKDSTQSAGLKFQGISSGYSHITPAGGTINGLLTFNRLPESSVVPSSNNQLVNKKYVDDHSGGGGIVTNDYEEITSNNTTYRVFTLAEHEPGWYAFTKKDTNDMSPIFFRGTTDNAYDKGYAAHDIDFLLYIPKAYSEIGNQEYAAFIFNLRPIYTNPKNIRIQSSYGGLMRYTQMPDSEAGVQVYKQYNDIDIGYATTTKAGTVIVGSGLTIDDYGVLSTTGAGMQYSIPLDTVLNEYDGSNRFTYVFDDYDDTDTIYDMMDALWEANSKNAMPIASYDTYKQNVIKYDYHFNQSSNTETGEFYLDYPWSVDYSSGEIEVLHIKGTLNNDNLSASKIEILLQVIQIPANQS